MDVLEDTREVKQGMYSTERDEEALEPFQHFESSLKDSPEWTYPKIPLEGQSRREIMEIREEALRDLGKLILKMDEEIFPKATSEKHAEELMDETGLKLLASRFPKKWISQLIENGVKGKLVGQQPSRDSKAFRTRIMEEIEEVKRSDILKAKKEEETKWQYLDDSTDYKPCDLEDMVVSLPTFIIEYKEEENCIVPEKCVTFIETPREKKERLEEELQYWSQKLRHANYLRDVRNRKFYRYKNLLAKLIKNVFPKCQTYEEVLEAMVRQGFSLQEYPDCFKEDIILGLQGKLVGQNDNGEFLKKYDPIHWKHLYELGIEKKAYEQERSCDIARQQEETLAALLPAIPLYGNRLRQHRKFETKEESGICILDFNTQQQRWVKTLLYRRFLAKMIREVFPRCNTIQDVYDAMVAKGISLNLPKYPSRFKNDMLKGIQGKLKGQKDDGYWCDKQLYGEKVAHQIRKEKSQAQDSMESQDILHAPNTISPKRKYSIQEDDFKNNGNSVSIFANKFVPIIAAEVDKVDELSEKRRSPVIPPFELPKGQLEVLRTKVAKNRVFNLPFYQFQDEAENEDDAQHPVCKQDTTMQQAEQPMPHSHHCHHVHYQCPVHQQRSGGHYCN